MRWLIFSLILLTAALLDAGNLLNVIALGSGHIRPSVLIVVMVFAALHTRRQDAVRCVFAVGFVADLVSASMGPYMIVYGILGTVLHGMSRAVNMKRFVHQGLVVFFALLLTEFPAAWLEAWKIGQSRPHLFSTVLGTAFYTAVFAPVFWMLLSGIWKRMYPRPKGHSRLR